MDAEKELDKITASLIAIRHVVARLLAHEAARQNDPETLFRDISEGIEKLLARHSKGVFVMDLEEDVRRETDWLIAAARGKSK